MGIYLFGSRSRLERRVSGSGLRRVSASALVDNAPRRGKGAAGNPDPARYVVEQAKDVNNHLVVRIRYPDCTNYEGRKVMVFENLTLNALKRQKLVDPHFCKNSDYAHPVARFEPTERGWMWALAFAASL